MRLGITRRDLQAALSSAKRGLPKRSTIPAISHVLLDARDDGTLHVSATNLDMCITAVAPARVGEPGAIAVPGRELINIAATSHGDGFVISTKGKALRLFDISTGARATMPTMPADDWPPIPASIAPMFAATTDAATFLHGLAFALFSAARSDCRHILNAVAVSFRPDHLRIAAANGFRLSVADVPARTSGDGLALCPTASIPRDSIAAFLAAVPKPCGECAIAVSPEGCRARLEVGNVTMCSHTSEGTFPNYEQIIPRDTKMSFTVGANAMLAALAPLARVAAKAENMVRLDVDTEAGHVALSARYEEQESLAELAVTSLGQSMALAYNISYLLDVLKAAGKRSITLNARNATGPARIDVNGDRAWAYVFMPMLVNPARRS